MTLAYDLRRAAEMNVSKYVHPFWLAHYHGLKPLKQLWNCSAEAPSLVHEFYCGHGAILALASRGETIAAGCQDGYVKVLDLETKTPVRTIIVQEVCRWSRPCFF